MLEQVNLPFLTHATEMSRGPSRVQFYGGAIAPALRELTDPLLHHHPKFRRLWGLEVPCSCRGSI